MSVAIFHDADVKNEARDNKRLISKKNKGKETLHIKEEKKDMLSGIEVKSEERKAKRLTLHNKDIASAGLDVSKAHDEYKGNDSPTSNGERTMTHPKNGQAEMTKRHGNRNNQYGGNKSRRLNIHREDKN